MYVHRTPLTTLTTLSINGLTKSTQKFQSHGSAIQLIPGNVIASVKKVPVGLRSLGSTDPSWLTWHSGTRVLSGLALTLQPSGCWPSQVINISRIIIVCPTVPWKPLDRCMMHVLSVFPCHSQLYTDTKRCCLPVYDSELSAPGSAPCNNTLPRKHSANYELERGDVSSIGTCDALDISYGNWTELGRNKAGAVRHYSWYLVRVHQQLGYVRCICFQ